MRTIEMERVAIGYRPTVYYTHDSRVAKSL